MIAQNNALGETKEFGYKFCWQVFTFPYAGKHLISFVFFGCSNFNPTDSSKPSGFQKVARFQSNVQFYQSKSKILWAIDYGIEYAMK